MTKTTAALRRQIGSARDLKSVVRTMKASAASAIGQYERSVAALADYALTVERGLGVCLRLTDPDGSHADGAMQRAPDSVVRAVVFGSDQGLVGRFNEVVVDHAVAQLAASPAQVTVWAVGERVHARLVDRGVQPAALFPVPGSVQLIARLVGQILLQVQPADPPSDAAALGGTLMLFHNRPTGSAYAPVSQRLLPLDARWQHDLAGRPWPAAASSTPLPEVLGAVPQALRAFIREHLFLSLFRASAEALASENASRLAAMQRADRNIGDLLTELGAEFNRTRQSGIDEELFEVIAGFDALSPQSTPGA